MQRNLFIVAAVALAAAGGAAAYVLLAHRAPAHPPLVDGGPSEHANEMDQAMGAVVAQYEAPDGGTPCETAFLAFKASQDYVDEHHTKAVVLWLAQRQDFLDKCASLPPVTQLCMGPRYLAAHRTECDKAKPAPDAAAAMVKLLASNDPAGH